MDVIVVMVVMVAISITFSTIQQTLVQGDLVHASKD